MLRFHQGAVPGTEYLSLREDPPHLTVTRSLATW